jgi:hypothetical protein
VMRRAVLAPQDEPPPDAATRTIRCGDRARWDKTAQYAQGAQTPLCNDGAALLNQEQARRGARIRRLDAILIRGRPTLMGR